MQGIGERLREARLRRKLEVVDVEEATKIRAKYIRALENEDFEIVPGGTTVRSFIRTYAEFLGLDAQLLVEEYRAQYEPRQESEMQAFATPRTRRPPRERERGWRPGRGSAVGAIVLALLGFLFVLGATGDDDDPPAPPPAAEEAPRSDRRGDGGNDRRRERRRRRPTTVSLEVRPAGATYVCVDRGSAPELFEGTIDAPRRFRGRRLRVNLGNRSTRLRVNGRAVRFAAGGDPIGFDLRPGRSPRQLPSGRRPCQ